MTYEETADLLSLSTAYWPGIARGTDPVAMAKAWAVALSDVPAQAARRSLRDLARSLKFPPTVAELFAGAQQYYVADNSWNRQLAQTMYEEFGNESPLYLKMQAEAQTALPPASTFDYERFGDEP